MNERNYNINYIAINNLSACIAKMYIFGRVSLERRRHSRVAVPELVCSGQMH